MCKCSPGFFQLSQRFSHSSHCEAAVAVALLGWGVLVAKLCVTLGRGGPGMSPQHPPWAEGPAGVTCVPLARGCHGPACFGAG